MIKKIVTHGGRAHLDEVMAISVLKLYYQGLSATPVERVNAVLPEDLENPEIMLIDVGMSLDFDKNNLDHHQYNGGKSAFELACDWLQKDGVILPVGVLEFAKQVSVWDAQGLRRFKEVYPEVVIPPFNSFRNFMIEQFETDPNSLVLYRIFGHGLKPQNADNIRFEGFDVPVEATLFIPLYEEWLSRKNRDIVTRSYTLFRLESNNRYKKDFSGMPNLRDCVDMVKDNDNSILFIENLMIVNTEKPLCEIDGVNDGVYLREYAYQRGFRPHIIINKIKNTRKENETDPDLLWSLFRTEYGEKYHVDSSVLDFGEHEVFKHANGFLLNISDKCDLDSILFNLLRNHLENF